MGHELDRNENTGELAYVGRLSAWHREGVVVPNGEQLTIERAIELGGLGFRVEKRQAYVATERTEKAWLGLAEKTVRTFVPAEGCHVVWRVDRGEPLGHVGGV